VEGKWAHKNESGLGDDCGQMRQIERRKESHYKILNQSRI